MTDNAPAPTASTSVAPAPARKAPAGSARWPLLALAGLILLSSWLAWSTQQRVSHLEAELVKRQQDSQGQAQEALLLARQAQDLAREAAARATLLDTRVAEVALQRSQVEELIKTMSRSRDENLLVDIDATLRVSMQQAALMGTAEPLVSALQTADERLARAQQPRLETVRRAIAKDLDRLKSTRVADLSSLAIRLDEAIRLVDEMPLLSSPSAVQGTPPGTADAQAVATPLATPGTRVGSARTATRAAASTQAPKPPLAQAEPAEPSWADTLLGWGQQASRTVWQEARALVRVTRIEHPETMLIAPDQAYFLRENLKLRLLNARLSLLSRQSAVANADLLQARQAIDRYFDTRSRKTQLMLSQLGEISTQSPQTQVPRPDDTLAALTALGAGR